MAATTMANRALVTGLVTGLLTAVALTGTLVANADVPAPASDSKPVAYDLAQPRPDSTNVIRNPGMGWALYAEEFDQPLIDADSFWRQVDPYIAPASLLYFRVPWSRMEPTKGRYAWDSDPNFRELVEGAADRGLRLAFRVYVDSQDSHMQATPRFVFDAGAEGYETTSNPDFQTPVVTDPIFRKHFGDFVTAFGKEFDDPAVVDYVDTGSLGWWGEMHNIRDMTPAEASQTLRWLTGLYRSAFSNVLLTLNFGPNSFSIRDQDKALRAGILIRRDSLGSIQWFPQQDKDAIIARWPNSPVVGENCYQNFTVRETSCDDYFKPIRAMLERVVADAKEIHSNYLDLRWPVDVETWVADNPDLVADFALNGGYRLAPRNVRFPTRITDGETARIEGEWVNSGVGRLPNDTPQWDDKYRLAYALLDPTTHRPVHQTLSTTDPGNWLREQPTVEHTDLTPTDVPPGTYEFATAIVDRTQDRRPAIRLALDHPPTKTGWHVLGTTTVGR